MAKDQKSKPRTKHELNWRSIAQTLEDHLFFENERQRSNLEEAFVEYCDDNDTGTHNYTSFIT